MKQYTAKWQELDQKFIALTPREKVMISGAVVVLLAVLLFKALIEPYLLELESLNKTNGIAQTNLSATNKQIELIQTALSSDPNENIKREIAQLQHQLTEVEAELEKVTTDYVAPEKMTTELTRLLKTSQDIRVVGISVLPAKRIDSNTELDLPVYYRHEFKVTVVGAYFPLMDFVKKITTKNKKFGVQHLEYEVNEHPNATMTLSLVTISDNENVIRL